MGEFEASGSRVVSEEAEDLYQRARAVEGKVIIESADTIRPDLRGQQIDNPEARRLYGLAADMGHQDAMNNLAANMLDRSFPKPEYYERSYLLYRRMAEMGNYRGYLGMGGLLLTGFTKQPPDETLATACTEKSAILAGNDDLLPSIALASLDLNTQLALMQAPPKPQPRIERGLALLENAIYQKNAEASKMMTLFYTHLQPDGIKAEYFTREAAKAGLLSTFVPLEGNYRMGNFGAPNLEMAACVKALSRDQLSEIETLCPRKDGPLTREMAGLPPAPTAPLDITEYLQNFRLRYPDL